jgi:hypothetical protein
MEPDMAEDTKTEMALKPCPFCGGPAIDYISGRYACCADDECVGYSVQKSTVAAWNTRARPSADQAEGVGEPAAFRARALGDRNHGWYFCDADLLPDKETLYSEFDGREYEVESLYAPGTDPAIARLTEERDEALRQVEEWRERARARDAECDQRARKQWDAEAALAQRDADIAKAVEDIEAWPHDLTAIDGKITGRGHRQLIAIAAALRASSATQADGGGK